MSASNPFASLFTDGVTDPQSATTHFTTEKMVSQEPEADRPSHCIYLQELSESLRGQDWLDLDTIQQALFERLMLGEPNDHLVACSGDSKSVRSKEQATETDAIRYLCSCYTRLHQQAKPKKEELKKCDEVILQNSRMWFQHPEFFPNTSDHQSFIDMLEREIVKNESSSVAEAEEMSNFFLLVAEEIHANQEEGSLKDCFQSVFTHIKSRLNTEISLGHTDVYTCIQMLMFFTKKDCLAEVFMESQSADPSNGKSWENTIFGAILGLSCIPKKPSGPFLFFSSPTKLSKKEQEIIDNNIHQPVSFLNEEMRNLFYGLLKASDRCRNQVLTWFGDCLYANKGRGKIWSTQMPMLLDQMYCSDAFFVNLCAVLLRLCKPFSEPCTAKLLKVQPTYCLATKGQREQVLNRNIHMRDISEETGLIPMPEGASSEEVQLDSTYNFITECFFLTHSALNLGVHVVGERLLRLNQDLHRIETVWQDVVRQGVQNSEPGQRIREQMANKMSLFLSLKASLTEPLLLDMMFKFNVASATWLIQLATKGHLRSFEKVSFPLANQISNQLVHIPELIPENIVDYMIFLRRFKDDMFELNGGILEHWMTFIIVFLGSPDRMRNPHLRAKISEGLEAMLPPSAEQVQRANATSRYNRERVFKTHPLISHLSESLLHVFVSIEMTGQSVEFEQKFNYRRPMYAILEHLWSIDMHRLSIKKLAVFAEEHIEDTDAPLFLRFINLLINDAIFLLDEAMQYMIQIKDKQKEQESEGWDRQPAQHRQEVANDLRQLTMLARFHNIMGNETIHKLELLTREIKSIFIHPVMVDRIAAMLNIFLLQLVGSKRKSLKVKDFDEVSFKPQETVSNICKIYLNLSDYAENDTFVFAVTSDGRSFSEQLFEEAKNVLSRIHESAETIIKFTEFIEKIKGQDGKKLLEEDLVERAPEEFLDPIIGILMREPVLLPSSQITVDKSTIARHLLSDQTDPFNRQPLDMSMVEPRTDLKEKLYAWIQQQETILQQEAAEKKSDD